MLLTVKVDPMMWPPMKDCLRTLMTTEESANKYGWEGSNGRLTNVALSLELPLR